MGADPDCEGRRVAVADLGSQALRLEVAEVDTTGVISTLYRERRPLMLARRGALAPRDIDEVVEVLGTFSHTARQYGVRLRAAATAVFRGQPEDVQGALIRGAAERAGVDLRILSPREEAAFSLRGSAGSLGLTGEFLHVEVGGGSCQISLGRGPELVDMVCVPMGAGSFTRWMDQLGTPCPVARRAAAESTARELMRPAGEVARAGAPGVGTGGTAKTLARIEALLAGQREPLRRPLTLSRGGLGEILREVEGWPCVSTGISRYGLTLDRAEVLKAGAILLDAAMAAAGLDRLTFCQDGIRAGLMRADETSWACACP